MLPAGHSSTHRRPELVMSSLTGLRPSLPSKKSSGTSQGARGDKHYASEVNGCVGQNQKRSWTRCIEKGYIVFILSLVRDE
ncbi:hypothetical protein RRG08_058492 [Elysia crispata]|uniref:Uncharacterized protein n=1 Tax=Elysia crispata TaxID=231223 RepID=A0AAE0Y652_9GAST|nr:hypothetical protein RRG08_058492 [Elysia crispata]